MTMSKEYKTIDTVKLRDLLEITRNIGRLLTEEEFNEIMMIYKKVIDKHWNELDRGRVKNNVCESYYFKAKSYI